MLVYVVIKGNFIIQGNMLYQPINILCSKCILNKGSRNMQGMNWYISYSYYRHRPEFKCEGLTKIIPYLHH